jgi:phospholipid/cholesterol/gamma-HCH transport system substrate-binding protein
MRSVSVAGRVAAIAAVALAVVLVAILIFRGTSDDYTVKAEFLNASQLVKGNVVQVGGTKAGSVKEIDVTADGRAIVTLEIQEEYKPLRKGTQAIIRQASLSGIANRYVDLQLAPAGQTGEYKDGDTIRADDTTTSVDLDQLFDVFDQNTRDALQAFFRNSALQFAGKADKQREALKYLNPALSTARRLFRELNRDTPLFERFIVDSARLVSTVADRRDDLAGLIGNLNETTGALGRQKVALAEAIQRLPDFMRRANTTFVNLRAALDDVDPLVNASKPVAPKLNELLSELRPLARDARPVVRDLNRVVLHPGKDNDLYNLTRTFPPLASTALDTRNRSIDFGTGRVNVGNVRGAFPEMSQALRDTAPIIAFGRPYTPDLFGWFDDFSASGAVDALGGFSRSQVVFGAFNQAQLVQGIQPGFIPLTQRGAAFEALADTHEFKRCPGAAEPAAPDGSNVWSAEEQAELDCDERHRGVGSTQGP